MSYKPVKQYTNHPLMDDIIYNTELILKDIVIKNDVLADQYETQESNDNGEIYLLIKDGNMTFTYFPFSASILKAFGYTAVAADEYLNNRKLIPVEDREALLEFACNKFLDEYVETNDYYRALNGEPFLKAGSESIIMVDPSWVPYTWTEPVDYNLPLYQQPNRLIAELTSLGIIDDLIKRYQGTANAYYYMYLHHLGARRIPYEVSRKAKKWDILYIPEKVEPLIQARFVELYNINKEIYLKRTYQPAYQFDSDYYDEILMIMVLAQTFNDMVVDVPEWYIRRDIFDIRSVQYFLEAYGVKYFKQIPLKYQIRIVKNLNKLIKYKSSDQNLLDILDIFDSDAFISKYYLFKEHQTNKYGKYIPNAYELEFIKTHIDDTYDNYVKDSINRVPYDDITYEDKYWDGVDTHEYIKNKILEQDFTVARTKYYSVDYEVVFHDYFFQISYFLGLLMDSRIEGSDDIEISVPSIDIEKLFRVSDLFIFILVHSMLYDNASTDIYEVESTGHSKPEGMLEDPYKNYEYDTSYYYKANDNTVYLDDYWSEKYNDPWSEKLPDINDKTTLDKESIEYWMATYYPEAFKDHVSKNKRTYGFNPEADLAWLSEAISHRHSRFGYERGWTLEDLGVDKFIVPNHIDSLDEMFRIYNVNKECYDNLRELMIHDENNKDDQLVMEFVFDYLFTKPYDYIYYRDASMNKYDTLEDLLRDRDYTLYNYYKKIAAETDIEAKQDLIRTILNDVITTLEYYIKGHGVDYILNISSVTSFWSLTNYIRYMVDFFKSYKVQFLEPYTTYLMNDQLDNRDRGNDTITEFQIDLWERDKDSSRDAADLGIEIEYKETPMHMNQYEKMDVYGYEDPDPLEDYDYNGEVPSSPDYGFKMADGGVANDAMNVPYFIVDAGPAFLGKDLWDLDGGTPIEQIDYVDADGGGVFHIRDEENLCGEELFTYIIDGGAPAYDTFISNAMITRVVDRQISSDVLVSDAKHNAIKVAEDGLYIEDDMVSWHEFHDWADEIVNSHDKFRDAYDILVDMIRIATDPNALNNRINKCTEDIMAGYYYVSNYMRDDYLEEFGKQYTDNKVTLLENEFKDFSPFSWLNL